MLFDVFLFISPHISLILFSAGNAEADRNIGQSSDGQLCLKYLYQKLLKLDVPPSSENQQCSRCFFSRHGAVVDSSINHININEPSTALTLMAFIPMRSGSCSKITDLCVALCLCTRPTSRSIQSVQYK